MDKIIRNIQLKILDVFSKSAKEFDVKEMIAHLDNEIKKFMTEVIIE